MTDSADHPTEAELSERYEAPFQPQPLTAVLLLDSLPQTETITALLESTHITEDLGIEHTGSVEDRLTLNFGAFGTVVTADFDEGRFDEIDETLAKDFVLDQELAELNRHKFIATVTAHPSTDAASDPREEAKQLALIQAFALQILTELPQVVGLHYGPAEATFGRNFIQNFMLAPNEPGEEWYPVEHQFSIRTTKPSALGTRSGYTIGLGAMGHPELQIENTTLSHDDLFTVLTNAAGYVLTQGSFEPGQEIAKGAQTSQIQLTTWLHDTSQPALLFQF